MEYWCAESCQWSTPDNGLLPGAAVVFPAELQRCAQAPYSYDNGTDTPATTGGYANRPASTTPIQDTANRIKTQVVRYNPIPTTPADSSTVNINAEYQAALTGTVWEHYELVITQWPSDTTGYAIPRDGGIYPQNCGNAFPTNGCVNTVAETYFQSQNDASGVGGNSCMGCHYTAAQTDFIW